MSDSLQELHELVEQVDEREAQYRRTLRMLLDRQRDREGHRIALSTTMGTNKSFLMSVPLQWIISNVSYAKDLPLFKSHIKDDTGKISINDITLPSLQQREPDWRRQLPMSTYLAIRKNHKFAPLLLVAYQEWVYDRSADKWGPDNRALDFSLTFENLDSKTTIVDLDTTNTRYFALDGQHRLMAIQGLRDLCEGRLYGKDQYNKRSKKISLSLDEIEEYYETHKDRLGLDVNSLTHILDETMGIEVIPAVQEGETYLESIARLRSIFVDVNENARRLEKGELTLLDEHNGFRIVARTLMVKHQLFAKGERVDEKSNQLSEKSPCYTTLAALEKIAQFYLCPSDDFYHWEDEALPVKTGLKIRPEDKELINGSNFLGEYFTALQELPSHKDMINGKPAAELRSADGDDNVLFRPIAQVALAKAIATLMAESDGKLGKLVGILSKYEKKGQLRLTSMNTPWFGILCDTTTKKMRRKQSDEDLCSEMFRYLLGGGFEQEDDRMRLKDNFWSARVVASGSDDKFAFNLSGELVEWDKFQLPNPWL